MEMGPGKTGYLSWTLKQCSISERRDKRRAFGTEEIREQRHKAEHEKHLFEGRIPGG